MALLSATGSMEHVSTKWTGWPQQQANKGAIDSQITEVDKGLPEKESFDPTLPCQLGQLRHRLTK